jgi:hypothetical protein
MGGRQVPFIPLEDSPFFFFFSVCTGVFLPSSSSSSPSFVSSSLGFSSSLSSSLSVASSMPAERREESDHHVTISGWTPTPAPLVSGGFY